MENGTIKKQKSRYNNICIILSDLLHISYNYCKTCIYIYIYKYGNHVHSGFFSVLICHAEENIMTFPAFSVLRSRRKSNSYNFSFALPRKSPDLKHFYYGENDEVLVQLLRRAGWRIVVWSRLLDLSTFKQHAPLHSILHLYLIYNILIVLLLLLKYF